MMEPVYHLRRRIGPRGLGPPLQPLLRRTGLDMGRFTERLLVTFTDSLPGSPVCGESGLTLESYSNVPPTWIFQPSMPPCPVCAAIEKEARAQGSARLERDPEDEDYVGMLLEQLVGDLSRALP